MTPEILQTIKHVSKTLNGSETAYNEKTLELFTKLIAHECILAFPADMDFEAYKKARAAIKDKFSLG